MYICINVDLYTTANFYLLNQEIHIMHYQVYADTYNIKASISSYVANYIAS